MSAGPGRDRRTGRAAGVARRLLRFHAANALISLAGSLVVTRLLTGSLGVDPIAANIVSILACGALNFGASEWLVFRRAAAAAMHRPGGAADVRGWRRPPIWDAVDLRAHTLQAWTAYEQRVDTALRRRRPATAPLLRAGRLRREGLAVRRPRAEPWRCPKSSPHARATANPQWKTARFTTGPAPSWCPASPSSSC